MSVCATPRHIVSTQQMPTTSRQYQTGVKGIDRRRYLPALMLSSCVALGQKTPLKLSVLICTMRSIKEST